MKRLVLAGLVTVGALGATLLPVPKAEAESRHCQVIFCNPCPAGYVLSPMNGNCCRCVPA